MPASKNPTSEPRWYVIPARILLITFLMTLLSFAVSLLLGIVGIVIKARLRGLHPDMARAYSHIAFPVAAVIGVAAFISASVMEVRHYRQAKALAQIERISR